MARSLHASAPLRAHSQRTQTQPSPRRRKPGTELHFFVRTTNPMRFSLKVGSPKLVHACKGGWTRSASPLSARRRANCRKTRGRLTEGRRTPSRPHTPRCGRAHSDRPEIHPKFTFRTSAFAIEKLKKRCQLCQFPECQRGHLKQIPSHDELVTCIRRVDASPVHTP